MDHINLESINLEKNIEIFYPIQIVSYLINFLRFSQTFIEQKSFTNFLASGDRSEFIFMYDGIKIKFKYLILFLPTLSCQRIKNNL